MPATGTSMTHTMIAARTAATTVSARVRMRAAEAAPPRGTLESVLLMSLPDRAEDGSLFCLAGVIVVEAVRASQFAMPE
jgi:hypothetical protein